MDKLTEAKATRAKAVADAQALLLEPDLTTPRVLTDDERTSVDELVEDEKRLTAEIEVMEADAARVAAIAAAVARMREPEARIAAPMPLDAASEAETRVLPAGARRTGRLKAFKGPEGELKAYRFGVWFAACAGLGWAQERARDQGIAIVRAASEGTNTAGGFVVLDEFESTLIDLREEYGVFRQFADVVSMSSDVKRISRRTGGLTVYFAGESEAGTESQKTWDQIALIARKLIALSKYSSELSEDAIINIGDDLAKEIAYAFAKKEDECGFMGDGSQTYGGIVGVGPSLTNLNGVDEGGGVIVGTGDIPSELTLADFGKVTGLLPGFADNPNTAWYCHKTIFGAMQRLEQAAGGNTIQMLVDGSREKQFLSYPVRWAQVMSTGTAVSQVLALFGDLAMAASLGTRRGTTIAISNSALNAFEQDELVIRGTERFDINTHDIGTATVAGPVVALVGKAS